MTLSRREFVATVGAAVSLPWLHGCSDSTAPPPAEPRLLSRPGTPTGTPVTGKTTIVAATSTAIVYAPPSLPPDPRVLVFLHGANRTADFFVDAQAAAADTAGVIVVAPFASGGGTWDAIHRRFSTDTQVIDAALAWIFERWNVDPARIVISGFSDGASYSLAIGRANGDLFSRVVAYSPGLLISVVAVGRPPVLITHGTQDDVLPIGATSRRFVPILRDAGYTVDYREFAGPHAVPANVLQEVVADLGDAT
jgi:predicted esterase